MATNNPILDKATGANNTASLEDPASNSRVQDLEALMLQAAERSEVFAARAAEDVVAVSVETRNLESAIKSTASSQGTINLANDIAALKSQNLTAQALEDSGAVSSQVAFLKELVSDQERLAELKEQRSDIVSSSNSFLSSLVNEFRVVGVDAKIEAMQAEVVGDRSAIAAITAAGESIAATNTLTRRNLTDRTVEANQELLVSKANQDLATTKLANIRSNADVSARLLNADSAQISAMNKIIQLEESQEARKIRREGAEQRKAEFDQRILAFSEQRELRDIQIERNKLALELERETNPSKIKQMKAQANSLDRDISQAVQVDQDLTEKVNRGEAVAGLPTKTSTATIRWMMKQGGAIEERAKLLFSLGQPGNNNLGDDIAVAYNNSILLDPEGNLLPKTQGMKFLSDIKDLVEADYIDKGQRPKDPVTLHENFVRRGDLAIKGMASNVITGDKTSLLAPPPMATLVASVPSIAEDKFYKTMIEPKSMAEVLPSTILNLGVEGIRAKLVTAEEVIAGMEKIGDGVAAYNNFVKDGGITKLGIPSQQKYITRIDRPLLSLESIYESTFIPNKVLKNTFVTPFGIERDEAAIAASIKEDFSRDMETDIMNAASIKSTLTTLLSFSPKAALTEEVK